MTVTREGIAVVAERIVDARRSGMTKATLNGVEFRLNERGYCQRFVRQVHEAAHLPTPWASCCAHSTQQHLEGAGLRIPNALRGCIVSFSLSSPKCSTCGQSVGHTAICLGNGMVAENTSATRGDPRPPGTKITDLGVIGYSRVLGYYSPIRDFRPSPYADGPCRIKVNEMDGPGYIRGERVFFPEGTPARDWAVQNGGQAYDHLPESNRVYIYVPGHPSIPGR